MYPNQQPTFGQPSQAGPGPQSFAAQQMPQQMPPQFAGQQSIPQHGAPQPGAHQNSAPQPGAHQNSAPQQPNAPQPGFPQAPFGAPQQGFPPAGQPPQPGSQFPQDPAGFQPAAQPAAQPPQFQQQPAPHPQAMPQQPPSGQFPVPGAASQQFGVQGSQPNQAGAQQKPQGQQQRQGKQPPRLAAKNLKVTYGNNSKPTIEGMNVQIPTGEFTVIVGPNACGKSTLLRTLARMLQPTAGHVFLDGKKIDSYDSKEVARRMSLLPQSPVAPDGIVVEDLVGRGRYPHHGVLQQWTKEDQEAVDHAMARARVTELADRYVSELSGGQRQRVWISLVLAQNSPIVLLDEPTTYLDITHQVEVLNLARSLQREGFTVVAVLHELTLAFRYATNLIMMKQGKIVAQGPVNDVVNPQLLQDVYNLECDLIADPRTGRPIVVPRDN